MKWQNLSSAEVMMHHMKWQNLSSAEVMMHHMKWQCSHEEEGNYGSVSISCCVVQHPMR
jgi:hypothetical protein